LECFSANSLLVALCRELGIPARLVVGHLVQSASKDGKAHLSTNNGHARTEIRDGNQRIRFDATPKQKENGENAGENGEDLAENQAKPSGE
jgi:transglutaminase-like putative cysteine protease